MKNYVNVHVFTTPENHPKNHLQKAPKWLQNQLKIDVGGHPRACSMFLSSLNHSKLFFETFFNFASQMGPKADSKMTPKIFPK